MQGKPVETIRASGALGFTLFITFIGAAIYFVQQSHGIWGVILALLKAAVWPAYLIYHAFLLLKV